MSYFPHFPASRRLPRAPLALLVAGAGLLAGCASTPSAAVAPPQAEARPQGFAVLAPSAARGSAWSLAQEVYLSPRLRPRLDEAQARVFAGDPPPAGARGLGELAETREAILDDGVASRRLLASLSREYLLEGLFVVLPGEAERPVVKVFVASKTGLGQFESFELRAAAGAAPWSEARAALERIVPKPEAPVAATVPAPARPAPAEGKAFYQSPWFWGAAGAAAVLGGAFFLATRDTSSDSIHLQMQVPR